MVIPYFYAKNLLAFMETLILTSTVASFHFSKEDIFNSETIVIKNFNGL